MFQKLKKIFISSFCFLLKYLKNDKIFYTFVHTCNHFKLLIQFRHNANYFTFNIMIIAFDNFKCMSILL